MSKLNSSNKVTSVTNYAYDANNRLTQMSNADAGGTVSDITKYYYDGNGNVITEQKAVYTDGNTRSNMILSGRTGGGNMKVYQYDSFNRLMQYNDGSSEAKYTYTADGLRASKTVNGTKTDFIWNGNNLTAEKKNGSTTVYTYDPTGIISSKKDNEGVIRFAKDPHGNVVMATQNNQLVGDYDYSAFGVQFDTIADIDNPFKYCGEYYDSESGNVYLRARYYNAQTGRFISEDPAQDGLNWYAYCGNNPVMFVDSSGLFGKNSLLQNGTKNPDVYTLQQALATRGYTGKNGQPLAVDGIFGGNTEYAVKNFQRANGLVVDGLVGKNTWEALGLSFDNQYESGGYTGTPSSYGRGTFVKANGFNTNKGISIGSFETGMAEIGGNYRYANWEVNAVNASAELGLSLNYIGGELGARLVSAEGGFKIPIPYTDKSLYIGGEGELFAVGFKSYWDREKGEIKIGISAIVGGSIVLGIK